MSAPGGIVIDSGVPQFYVPAGDSVVALVAINDTPDVREAAVGLAELVTGGTPSLVVVDYRTATITTLDLAQIDEARMTGSEERPERVTHGRHCSCSACAREDWTRITGPCGMHGPGCPAVYAPLPLRGAEEGL